MTDDDLVAKKLAFIETCVEQLRTLAEPRRVKTDIREERFIVHTLQLAIQAALDVASHIVSDRRLGEPQQNRELFELLCRNHLIPATLERQLVQMAGFRNIVVHGYQNVNLDIVIDVVENHLNDLLAFTAHIRAAIER